MNIKILSLRLAVVACVSATSHLFAAASGTSADGIYQLQPQIHAFRAQASVLRPIQNFQPFVADIDRIKSILSRVPPPGQTVARGVTIKPVELSLPMPDGGKYSRFIVEEVAIM